MWFFTPCRQILPLAALVREELSPFPTAFSISRHFRRSMDAHDPQETQQQENLATTDRRRNKSTKQGGIAPGKMCFSLSVVQTYHTQRRYHGNWRATRINGVLEYFGQKLMGYEILRPLNGACFLYDSYISNTFGIFCQIYENLKLK